MRRKIILAAITIAATLHSLNVYAEEPKRMLTTAYCTGTTTASGTQVHEGVAAVNRQRMGLTAIVYEDTGNGPGQILGIFECEDTGIGGDSDGDGIGAIQEGKVIDIYRSDLDRAHEWMKLTGGSVYVQFIEAEG